jgi:HNH endonuclease
VKPVRKWKWATPWHRFRSKIKIIEGCWIWTGAKEKSGYGKFTIGKVTVIAHCYSYEELIGPIPEGKTLDHLCRNESCVNPDHLEPVTQRINLLRGDTFQARNAAKTHCCHGHPFDEANTYWKKERNGGLGRGCKACNCIRKRNRRTNTHVKP